MAFNLSHLSQSCSLTSLWFNRNFVPAPELCGGSPPQKPRSWITTSGHRRHRRLHGLHLLWNRHQDGICLSIYLSVYLYIYLYIYIYIHIYLYIYIQVFRCCQKSKCLGSSDPPGTNSNSPWTWCWLSWLAKMASILDMGLSENSVPNDPMVNDHYPY